MNANASEMKEKGSELHCRKCDKEVKSFFKFAHCKPCYHSIRINDPVEFARLQAEFISNPDDYGKCGGCGKRRKYARHQREFIMGKRFCASCYPLIRRQFLGQLNPNYGKESTKLCTSGARDGGPCAMTHRFERKDGEIFNPDTILNDTLQKDYPWLYGPVECALDGCILTATRDRVMNIKERIDE